MNHVSISKVIKSASNAIIKAKALHGNHEACCKEAKRVYTSNAQGMYKRIARDAKVAVETAERLGLTPEKPYIIVNGVGFGVSLNCSLALHPMFGKAIEPNFDYDAVLK